MLSWHVLVLSFYTSQIYVGFEINIKILKFYIEILPPFVRLGVTVAFFGLSFLRLRLCRISCHLTLFPSRSSFPDTSFVSLTQFGSILLSRLRVCCNAWAAHCQAQQARGWESSVFRVAEDQKFIGLFLNAHLGIISYGYPRGTSILWLWMRLNSEQLDVFKCMWTMVDLEHLLAAVVLRSEQPSRPFSRIRASQSSGLAPISWAVWLGRF